MLFSPNGNLFAILSCFNRPTEAVVTLWDFRTNRIVLENPDALPVTRTVNFSTSGQLFVYQAGSGRMTVWSVLDESVKSTSPSPRDWVFGATFSKDDKLLATLYYSMAAITAMIVDVDSGSHIRTIDHACWFPQHLTFSDDGTYLMSEQGEVQVHIDPVDPANSGYEQRTYWRHIYEWIVEGNRKMLWVPPQYRSSGRMVCYNGLVAFSNPSCEPLYFELAKDRRLTYDY